MSHEALIREVCRDPGNPEPRLIYADWLQEQGNLLGEYIAIRERLVKLADDDPRLPELGRQAQQALYNAREQNRGFSKHQAETGFLESVDCTSYLPQWSSNYYAAQSATNEERKSLDEAAKRVESSMLRGVCRTHPVNSLVNWLGKEFSGLEQIRRLEYRPHVFLSRYLHYTNDHGSICLPPNLQILCCPALSPKLISKAFSGILGQLKSFALHGYQEDATVARLVNNLSSDSKLILSRFQFPDTSARILAGRTIDIQTGTAGLQGIFRAFRRGREDFPTIERLNIWGWDIESRHLANVMKAGLLRGVKRMDLPRSSILGAKWKWQTPKLESLTLNSFESSKKFSYGCFPTVTRASIFNIPYRGDAQSLVRFLSECLPNLRRLDLGTYGLADDQFKHFLKSKVAQQLTHLRVRNNAISRETYEWLLDNGPWANLVGLDLKGFYCFPMSQHGPFFRRKLRGRFGLRFCRLRDDELLSQEFYS